MKSKFFRVFLIVMLLCTSILVSPQVYASFENFLTWAEVDGGDEVTVSQYSVEWTNEARASINYVYNDLGVDYLDTSFQVTFQAIRNTSDIGADGPSFWAVANDLGTRRQFTYETIGDYLGLIQEGANQWTLAEVANSTYYASGTSFTPDISTTYYITIIRDELTGTYGQLKAYFYSNAAMTSEYLVDTLTLNLHQKNDFRYIYSHQSYGTAGAFNFSGLTSYMEVTKLTSGEEPLVITTSAQTLTGKVRLSGWASAENGALDYIGFQIGTSTGNYTDNYTASFMSGSSEYFYADLTSSNLTVGETYYFLASANNTYGYGFGSEHSFIASFQTMTIATSEIQTEEQANGKFSGAFDFFVSPNNVNTAYGRMSTSVNFTDSIDLVAYITAVLSDGQGQYSYITYNSTHSYGLLDADTTYYYQGYFTFEQITYYGKIKSFTTTSAAALPDKPIVTITSIENVSDAYGGTYLFEFKAKGSSGNNTDTFYTQGFDFSLYYNESAGVLLPTIYSYLVNKNPDNTFSLVVNLDTADWFTGQTLYIRAFVNTLRHGKVYSTTASYSVETDDGSGIVTDGDTDESITLINDLVKNVRSSLGLTGIMGTWAFMALIILLISIVFGGAMVATKDDTIKRVIGIVWGLASIAILGAFMFTGELGIWPILVMVGGLVVVVFIIAGTALSGSRQNG